MSVLLKSESGFDEFFKNLFPENYKTEFIAQHYTDESNTMGWCRARIALRCKDDFDKWLKDHQQLTGVTYRLRRTQACKGKYSLFKADYRCQHNTLAHLNKSKQPAKKHTCCPANLSVTIKAVIENTRSMDPYLPFYPATININHTHNHDLHALEAIRHRDPSEAVKETFLELFKLGHTPSHSLKVHKRNLLEEHQGKYSMVVADRSYCPDINWVFRLYHKYIGPKTRKKSSGANKSVHPSDQVENLENSEVNPETKENEENLSLASIIPIMGDSEDMSSTSEILLVDSMGNVIHKCKPSDLSDQIWLSYEGAQERGSIQELTGAVEDNGQAEFEEENEQNHQEMDQQAAEEEELNSQEKDEGLQSQAEEEREQEEEEVTETLNEDKLDDLDVMEKMTYEEHRRRYHMGLLENLFDNIMANVGQHYASHPGEFENAIQTAHSTFEGITTKNALVSALATFGKNSEEMTSPENGIQTNATLNKRKMVDDETIHFTKTMRLNQGISEHCYAVMRPA